MTAPAVYLSSGSAGELRRLASLCFSLQRCRHHYLNMAAGNYREHLRADRVRGKKYLYVVRPILAVRGLARLARSGRTLVSRGARSPCLRSLERPSDGPVRTGARTAPAPVEPAGCPSG